MTPRNLTMLSARPNTFDSRRWVLPHVHSPGTNDITSLVLKRIIGAACLKSVVTTSTPLAVGLRRKSEGLRFPQ